MVVGIIEDVLEFSRAEFTVMLMGVDNGDVSNGVSRSPNEFRVPSPPIMKCDMPVLATGDE